MRIEEIGNAFAKRQAGGLRCALHPPASDAEIEAAERRLHVTFPAAVLDCYRFCNGLQIEDPAVDVWPLERIAADASGLLTFAVFNAVHIVAFDPRALNDAGQWDIVTVETKYRITLTMASFWTNKLFAWIDKRRPIWTQEHEVPPL